MPNIKMTKNEYNKYVNDESYRMLGVSFDKALEMVQCGEIQGSLAETRIKLFYSFMRSNGM
jgi:hypothetical protein